MKFLDHLGKKLVIPEKALVSIGEIVEEICHIKPANIQEIICAAFFLANRTANICFNLEKLYHYLQEKNVSYNKDRIDYVTSLFFVFNKNYW